MKLRQLYKRTVWIDPTPRGGPSALRTVMGSSGLSVPDVEVRQLYNRYVWNLLADQTPRGGPSTLQTNRMDYAGLSDPSRRPVSSTSDLSDPSWRSVSSANDLSTSRGGPSALQTISGSSANNAWITLACPTLCGGPSALQTRRMDCPGLTDPSWRSDKRYAWITLACQTPRGGHQSL